MAGLGIPGRGGVPNHGAGGGKRRVLIYGAGVLVLALVITVGAGLGSLMRSNEPVSFTSADKFAEAAQQAASAGDTSTAQQMSLKALAVDPGNAKAKAVLRKVTAATPEDSSASKAKSSTDTSADPAPGGSSNPSSTTSPDEGFTTALPHSESLLPSKFASFDVDKPVITPGDVSVSSSAKQASQPASTILWAIHDRTTTSDARAFTKSTSASLYASDKATVTVDGVPAYFGTDGVRFATVSYNRGRYVFEVLVTATGVKPGTLKTLATSAAQAFGDHR